MNRKQALMLSAILFLLSAGFSATLTVSGVNGYVIVRQGVGAETIMVSGPVEIPDGLMVELIAKPRTGYSFVNWSGDLSGSRLMMRLLMNGNKTVTAHYEPWRAPIGIPEPSFGIRETYRMYDDPGSRNPALTYTQNAEGGYYTHYIDNTHPQATNTNNHYGTAARPRLSLPAAANVPAGSVVEIHGQSYPLGYTIYTVQGTASQPIFIRGHSELQRPVFADGDLYINSQYLIIENLKRTGSGFTVRTFAANSAHHVAVRNCEAQYVQTGAGAVSYDDGHIASHAVFYNNYFHLDNFDPNGPDFPEDDETGVHVFDRSEYVWIVDNYLHTAKGDAVGAGHAANYTARYYYVGRNVMHTCGENAIDLKEVDTAIISENIMYNFRGWSSGSDGTAAVFHYGPINSPQNVWFLFNEVFACTDKGIQAGGNQRYPVYIIGNVIHDVGNSGGTGRAFSTWDCREVFFANNVFYNVDNGIHWGVQGTNARLVFNGNIISGVSAGGSHLYVEASSQRELSEITDNIFFQPGGQARILWGSTSYTVAQWQAASGKGQGSLEADPRFVNPAAFDFHLQSASPAIDKTGEESIYQLFQETFGIGIRYDADGNARPQGSAWDIGAYEYSPSGTDTQTIQLQPGWNWISFNIFPSNRSLDDIFGGIIGQVEQVRTQTQSALRLNGQWVGDLINMDGIQTGKMYKVRVNAACTLTVTGTTIAPTTPISLVSGWNWAAYYPVAPQVIGTSLSSITGQAQQAKSQTQSTIFQNGQWLGDLTQMEPGKGYTILMSGLGTLTYPGGQ